MLATNSLGFGLSIQAIEMHSVRFQEYLDVPVSSIQ